MIHKNSVKSMVFCIAWINGVFGSSYSTVYVNSGSNVDPYQYVRYGTPAVAYSAPIAQLSSPPVQSVVPYPQPARFVAPCVSPCIPQQPVAQVANAGLVAYTAPRTPVVVAGDVPSNYEYSYVVYDDGTGDQKAARELSDSGVVRGQYSFLQPDGYVREVQYTADDATGFNAVVNYVPEQKIVEAKEAKPCPEVKPEALKQAETPKVETSPDSGETSEAPKAEENKSPEETPASGEESAIETTSERNPDKNSSDKAPIPKIPASEAPASSEEIKEEPTKGSKKDSSAENPAKEEAKPVEEPAKVEETKSEGSKGADPSGEAVSAEVKEQEPQSLAPSAEDAIVEPVAAPQPILIPQPVPAVLTNTVPVDYVSYDQLLKCIQKMQNAELRTNSPLTYILLPSNAKLC